MLLDNATQQMNWTNIEPIRSSSHKKETHCFPQIAHTHTHTHMQASKETKDRKCNPCRTIDINVSIKLTSKKLNYIPGKLNYFDWRLMTMVDKSIKNTNQILDANWIIVLQSKAFSIDILVNGSWLSSLDCTINR